MYLVCRVDQLGGDVGADSPAWGLEDEVVGACLPRSSLSAGEDLDKPHKKNTLWNSAQDSSFRSKVQNDYFSHVLISLSLHVPTKIQPWRTNLDFPAGL